MKLVPTKLLFLLLLALLAGCEDSVNPILESDRNLTMFGTLDMNADRQFIRVIPVRRTIDEVPDPSQITLRSIDLNLGSEIEWTDSLVTFDNGRQGLVFFADFRVRPGHSYRIEATQDGTGIITSAETNIPPVPTITIEPETASRSITPSGFVFEGQQTVVWHNLQREPHEINRWYRFLRTPSSPFDDIEVPPGSPPVLAGSDLTVRANLVIDRVAVEDSINIAGTALVGVGISITVLNVEFDPPGGAFDPEVLAQPGTFTNVENGFGFIGAVGRFSAEWTFDPETLRILQYLSPQDAFGKQGSHEPQVIAAGRLIAAGRQTAAAR